MEYRIPDSESLSKIIHKKIKERKRTKKKEKHTTTNSPFLNPKKN